MVSEKAKEILVNAKKLIENGWTQDAFARNAEGERINEIDENACSFCMLGAISRSFLEIGGRPEYVQEAVQEVVREVDPERFDDVDSHDHYITTWNDRLGRTKEQVVSVLEKITK